MKKILIVGAGLSGLTIARSLAEENYQVDIIDKRDHIGGNIYDFINENNERIHAYGPHLLHGSKDSKEIKWLTRFTDWVNYEHLVKALLDSGDTVPLPINATTIEKVFKIKFSNENEVKNFLDKNTVKCEVKNSKDVFLKSAGKELSNIFFIPYTKKMWGVDPIEIEAAVGKRVPVRTNRDERYFVDNFQRLPKNGYTELAKNICDHENIKVYLQTSFDKKMIENYYHTFHSGALDEYFEFKFGELPYRSIKFENRTQKINNPAVCVNFTDHFKYTRMTQWDLLPNSEIAKDNDHTITYEIPCDPKENNNKKFYPVRNKKSLALYEKYKQILEKNNLPITFIGRIGLFKYIDMVPAVGMHLKIAKDFIKKNK